MQCKTCSDVVVFNIFVLTLSSQFHRYFGEKSAEFPTNQQKNQMFARHIKMIHKFNECKHSTGLSFCTFLTDIKSTPVFIIIHTQWKAQTQRNVTCWSDKPPRTKLVSNLFSRIDMMSYCTWIGQVWSRCLKYVWNAFKGIVHPKMKLLSSFTHPQVVPNLYECLCSDEHKGR